MKERELAVSAVPARISGRLGTITLLAFAFLVPLAMWLGFADGVEFPKHILLRFLAVTMALAVLVRPESRAALAGHPLLIPLSLLSFAAIVSTVASGSPVVSWVGEDGSWRGSSTLAAVWLGALMAGALAAGGNLERKWVGAVLASAGLALVYAFVQAIGVDPVPWDPGKRIAYWVMATLGNPVHLGNFLVCAFFLTFAVMPRGRVLIWAFRVLLLAGVVATLSRSAFLSLMFGGAVWIAFRRVRGSGVGGKILMAVAAPAAALPFLDQIERVFLLTRLAGARPRIWEAACRIIADHPLAGCGPDLFYSVFPSFAGYGFYLAEPPPVFGDSVFLRLPASAHSELLDTASMLGIPALGLWIWALFIVVKTCRNSPFLPALAGLWIGLQVNPSSVATSALFWTMAVMAVRPECPGNQPARGGGGKIPLAIVAVLLAALVTALHLAGAQSYRRESGRLLYVGDRPGALALQERWWKFAARAHPRQASADAAILAGSTSAGEQTRADLMLSGAMKVNPLNIFYLSESAELDYQAGLRRHDSRLLKSAEGKFRRVLSMAPSVLSLHDDLARVLEAEGRKKEARLERLARKEADTRGVFIARPAGGDAGK